MANTAAHRHKMQWFSHIVRMNKNAPDLKVLDAVHNGGGIGREKSTLTRIDQVAKDLTDLGISKAVLLTSH